MYSDLLNMSGNYYFAIVGHHDNPLYETEMAPSSKVTETKVHAKSVFIKIVLAHVQNGNVRNF